MSSATVKRSIEIPDDYPSRQSTEPEMRERQDPVFFGSKEDFAKPDSLLGEEEILNFEQKGFLFYPNLFSPKEIQALNSEVRQLENNAQSHERPEYIREPGSGALRSIFYVHSTNEIFKKVAKDRRLLHRVRQILNSDVYIHQSRINRKPGLAGKEFYWHSDFETWHQEDGMPRMRAISCSLFLSANDMHNGPTMVMPGSHKKFISCVGKTPEKHYLQSLKQQEYGVPDAQYLKYWDEKRGIEAPIGPAGSALFFDCNLLHGSNSNITPRPRSNLFLVYNSVHNRLEKPFSGQEARPEHIASRNFTPVEFL